MSEAESKPVEETKKKKYVRTKADIEKIKKRHGIRKRLRIFLAPINMSVIKTQILNKYIITSIKKNHITHERKKLIFNLLVKSWFSHLKYGKIKCKFGLTSKGAELYDKIDIIIVNKYEFIIRGLGKMDEEWSKHFKLILNKQFSNHKTPNVFSRVTTQTRKNRFIIEKNFD